MLLSELGDSLRPQAQARGLYLGLEGPKAMPVSGDGVKIRRITQNLIINAIKYTRQGGIDLSWGACEADDDTRWFMQVRDTGPGFHAGPGTLLVGALEVATERSREMAEDESTGSVTHVDGELGMSLRAQQLGDRRPAQQQPGEGIGLSIVKRLCELLDATIEIDSQENIGTTFRILLPRRYEA